MRAFGEWEKQELLFLSLPHAGTDWREYLDEILASYEQFVAAITPFQKVALICPDEQILARFGKFKNAQLIKIDTDDTWIRDYGMIDVERGGEILSYDFKFNAWGGKFKSAKDDAVNGELAKILGANLKPVDLILEGGSIDFNGSGVMLTTEMCLLNDNRNPHLNKEQIDARLKELFGLDRIIWLKNGFIRGDDTDSHVDTLARFISPDTIAYASCDDPDDEHFKALNAMRAELEMTGFKLVPLPLPKAKFYCGKRLGCTYVNFIFINGALIVPTYDDANDELVIERLRAALPGREVIGVNSLVFVRQNGSLHCSSQNKYHAFAKQNASSERSEAKNKYAKQNVSSETAK
ncbi:MULTISPECIES: agmatine deiminase family protein [Campylobacter]|uniref:agmatine deiminase family protein n=1 Tax=Campylobacter TaxID=194 RepID=UPI0014701FC4|nr:MULTISPECIES: agmatine deiminase family protein [Campylobacter]MBN7288368.1 agmatine deiminase family protein [Campylobacter curvus]MDU6827427.1 agmatine deiminase family protein [Campylobacter sp.]